MIENKITFWNIVEILLITFIPPANIMLGLFFLLKMEELKAKLFWILLIAVFWLEIYLLNI